MLLLRLLDITPEDGHCEALFLLILCRVELKSDLFFFSSTSSLSTSWNFCYFGTIAPLYFSAAIRKPLFYFDCSRFFALFLTVTDLEKRPFLPGPLPKDYSRIWKPLFRFLLTCLCLPHLTVPLFTRVDRIRALRIACFIFSVILPFHQSSALLVFEFSLDSPSLFFYFRSASAVPFFSLSLPFVLARLSLSTLLSCPVPSLFCFVSSVRYFSPSFFFLPPPGLQLCSFFPFSFSLAFFSYDLLLFLMPVHTFGFMVSILSFIWFVKCTPSFALSFPP